MEPTNVQAKKRMAKWSRGKRGPLWTSSILLVLVVAGYVWSRAANDPPVVNIPSPTLPSPNAYDYYLKANQQSVGNPISQPGKPTPAQMIAALPPNLPALKTFREGMAYPFLNPPMRSFNVPLTDMASFRNLARLLLLEGRVYDLQGNYGGAAQAYLDCLRLGQDVPRGGVLITFLVGIACEAIGRRDLWDLTEKLSAADARAAAKRLEELNRNRYPFAQTMQEEKWSGQAGWLEILRTDNSWRTRLVVLVRSKKRIFQDYTNFMDASIALISVRIKPDSA